MGPVGHHSRNFARKIAAQYSKTGCLTSSILSVFAFSARTAARWIAQGIAKANLHTVATGTGVKGPGSHSLCHSCARHWLQSGLSVNAVSAWLGHSSPTVTLNTYLVLVPDTLGDISEVP